MLMCAHRENIDKTRLPCFVASAQRLECGLYYDCVVISKIVQLLKVPCLLVIIDPIDGEMSSRADIAPVFDPRAESCNVLKAKAISNDDIDGTARSDKVAVVASTGEDSRETALENRATREELGG